MPEASAAKLQDFPTHLWWCRLDRSTSPATLVFTAKTTPYFDEEIDGYLKRAGLEKQMARMLQTRFPENIVALRWEGELPHRVEGELDPAFVERVFSTDAPHHAGVSLASTALTKVVLTGRGHRPPPVAYDAVVKPALRTGAGALLEPRIYRL